MMRALLLVLVMLAGCGGGAPSSPDMGAHCGNGNVYCTGDEVCISGDCVPACLLSDMGC